ncbi:MAG: helix-turn-helix transcriptional regulator [Dehalococcoidia bacterium]|nr:MAG: transcriptional regulator [bacterium]MCE7926909.1 transcriptional regulator [Chloroflexi bacterium CFX7]MCL4232665.1 helix-turn-helix transcriptional regulator [Dehalococcoidia bacterium]NUQ56139.1 helix-turn-helix transcriptional regulator [Dehalococcoidia bacterium]RIL02877.1 MAG: hypothetical protein DCC78_05380 [bacterium]
MTQRSAPEAPRKATYNHPCLIAQTLDVLGDRWTLLILRDLMAGLHRYTEILDSCQGMSPNVLSDRLKRLEAEGLVVRHYEKGLPPRVEYTLTEKGWAVRPVLLALIGWGREFLNPFTQESVGLTVSADFAVRVLPTFSFHPERAADLQASMVVEIADCVDCNTWTFDIHDGHMHPRRHSEGEPDIRLRTNIAGFFRFLRGEALPEECGELEGAIETAHAIQACFLGD